ncbi:hypothetical protein OS493_027981 [Desmophyllum pertusum]|uniref:Uncharacterized protein n=1 Tax=Desmophyllum pertusum TaxID=174260 RepID=A0A9X0CDI9_9CNID|nr:hypothetical protein OS493_027981 [Desmophyllum pertusum]
MMHWVCSSKKFSEEVVRNLVLLSVFPSTFSAEDIQFLFEDKLQLQTAKTKMMKCALLQKGNDGKYSLHPLKRESKTSEAFRNCFEETTHKGVKLWAIDVANILSPPKECTELYKKCCDISEAYAEKKRHADSLNSFGFRRLRDVEDLKDHQGTLDIFQEAYKMREALPLEERESERHAHTIINLGRCYLLQGEDERGRELIHEGINIRVMLGVSLHVAAGYADLGRTYRHCGDFLKAIELWTTKTLPVYREELGEHPWTASILYYLADSHKALANGISGEDTDKAMTYVKEALKLQKSLMGIHRDTARSRVCLSDVLRIQRQWELALKELEKGLEIQKDVLGPDHEKTIATRNKMAEVRATMRRQEESKENREETQAAQDHDVIQLESAL